MTSMLYAMWCPRCVQAGMARRSLMMLGHVRMGVCMCRQCLGLPLGHSRCENDEVVLGESDSGDRAHGDRWDVAAYRCGGGESMVVLGELV
jgi:hypothetical protein